MTVISYAFRNANTHPLLSRAIKRHANVATVRFQMMECEEALAEETVRFQPEDVDCLLRLLFLPLSVPEKSEAVTILNDNLARSVNFLFHLSLRDADVFTGSNVDNILDQMCGDRVSNLNVIFHLGNTLSALAQFRREMFETAHVEAMKQLRHLQPQLQNKIETIVNEIEGRSMPSYLAWRP